jgi:hypothetical protein
MDYHGLLLIIVAQCGLSWIIVDSEICTTMKSHGLEDMHPKPLTTNETYGAGMAHTVASIGHVLSWSYYGYLWITMDYRLSWTIMDDRGFSWIIIDYHGLWTMVDYHGLWTIMD